jgi:hypothetical protein
MVKSGGLDNNKSLCSVGYHTGKDQREPEGDVTGKKY